MLALPPDPGIQTAAQENHLSLGNGLPLGLLMVVRGITFLMVMKPSPNLLLPCNTLDQFLAQPLYGLETQVTLHLSPLSLHQSSKPVCYSTTSKHYLHLPLPLYFQD